MKSGSLCHLVVVIAALHVIALSLIFGLRHIGYFLVATLSAMLIWGVVFLVLERRRRTGLIVGVLVGLAIQQAAYQSWKAELPGFWWPMAQFGGLSYLAAYGFGKATSGNHQWNPP